MLIKYKDFNANLALTISVITQDDKSINTYYIIFVHSNAVTDDYNYWIFKNKEERDKVFKLIMSNFTDLERC